MLLQIKKRQRLLASAAIVPAYRKTDTAQHFILLQTLCKIKYSFSMRSSLNADMPRPTPWYTLPLSHNPKSARPLYAVLFGLWCWQLTALLWRTLDSSWGFYSFGASVVAGTGCLLGGFLASFVYRCYRVSLFTLLAFFFSLPSCMWLVCFVWGRCTLPSFAGWYLQHYPAFLWLCLQLIWLTPVLWRSCWRLPVKAVLITLATFGLVGVFTFVNVRAAHEVANAPHIKAASLAHIYAASDPAAIRQFDRRRIVVTGGVYGSGEGIIGWGGPDRMDGDILFDDSVGSEALTDGQVVSVIGTCGKNRYGMVSLTDSRVIR